MGTDTIAAIATAMTSSGIGIVRISGDEAVSITDRIFEMKNQKKLEDMPTHTIHYGHIHDGDEVIDEVMVLLMRGPKSYSATRFTSPRRRAMVSRSVSKLSSRSRSDESNKS